MRSACLGLCAVLAAATAAAAPNGRSADEPEGYCISETDFYAYRGELCLEGYQLALGNCRQSDGRLVARSREECMAKAGHVELPTAPLLPIGEGARGATPAPR